MKYVLIGCGRISINHIKAAYSNNLEVVGLCDIALNHIDNLLKKSGLNLPKCKKYDDYKKMIDDTHPNLAAIATESGKHAEIALYCIEHGINIIVEKPMALSIDDAQKMIDAAKKHNVQICVCHQNRFNTAVVETKKAIDENRLGKISHASICVRWNRGFEYYNQANWRGTWEEDGGALMNQCIHGIDLLLYLVGSKVNVVYGQTRLQLHPYLETEDIGMAVLSFENGAIGTIEGTVNVFPKNLEETLYLFGEKGTIKIGGVSANAIELWQLADIKEHDNFSKNIFEQTSNVYGNGHKLLYSDMIEAINYQRKPLVSGEEGKKALEIVLSIYKSELTKRPIELPLMNFKTLDMKGHF